MRLCKKKHRHFYFDRTVHIRTQEPYIDPQIGSRIILTIHFFFLFEQWTAIVSSFGYWMPFVYDLSSILEPAIGHHSKTLKHLLCNDCSHINFTCFMYKIFGEEYLNSDWIFKIDIFLSITNYVIQI